MFEFEMPPLDWRIARIPKKSGGMRTLYIPNDRLMEVQRNILQDLYKIKELRPTSFAHGFVPYRSTLTGALIHYRNAGIIIGMDIYHFFDKFPPEAVRPKLLEAGILPSTVDRIMKVCTYKGMLPQGAPTSPYMTNIGMIDVDCMLSAYLKDRGFTYSRYADDISAAQADPEQNSGFHEMKRYTRIIKGVELILSNLGLELNRKKTHVAFKNGVISRRVTGIVIRNDGKGYNAPRKLRNYARVGIHKLYWKVKTSGVEDSDKASWRRLKGIVQYLDKVRSISPDIEAQQKDPSIAPGKYNFLQKTFEGGKNAE